MTRRGQTVAAAAVVLLSATSLGACTSGGPAAGGSTSLATTTSTSTSTTIGAQATTTTFDEATNARPDVVAVPPCRRDAAGAWEWTGTVSNKTAEAHTYTIIVDFTDSAATVEDTKKVVVHGLPAGHSASWTVSGATGKTAVTCVIRSARIS